MPTVKQLIENLSQENKNIVTTDINEPLAIAWNKMLEHNFTQLPFLYGSKHYFLTTTSILCTLSAYGDTIKNTKLTVTDVEMVAVRTTYTDGDDIFDVMKEVEQLGAALILNDKGISNIITPYDTAIYFQQWSEDTMHVREIERELKDIINQAFKDAQGNINLVDRQKAVDSVSSNFMYSRDKLLKGLKTIRHIEFTSNTLDSEIFNNCFKEVLSPPANGLELKIEDVTLEKVKTVTKNYIRKIVGETLPVQDLLNKAFPDIFGEVKHVDFDELTLAQYIQILLGPVWDRCRDVFKLDKEKISFILEGARETRNKLAHFREENITPQDRTQLRLCNDLLNKTKRCIFDRKIDERAALDM